MLRRNSSNRLSRRKSTSSVQSKHDSIDPEIARQHAHTAATLAFARAQERSNADVSSRGGGIIRGNNVQQQYREQMSHQNNSLSNGDRQIKRQQSVRFVGPNAVQRRYSIGSKTGHHHIVPQTSSSNLGPIALTTNTPVPAAYRPPSRSSSIGKASASKATVESYIAAAGGEFDEYYTREDDVASTPSSYRRIRRSKSMFSPLKAPSVFYTNGSPDRPETLHTGRQNNFSTSQTPKSQPAQAPLRAPKSMSFLRGGRDHMTPGLRERNDATVQMARDRFFHQATQQRLREQPSFLFRSKAQRHEKPFRKSVRSSSTNSHGMPVASSNEDQPPKESALKDAARKASKTIKTKLKWVFGRSKQEPVVIPNQQVDARETHVRQYVGDSSVKHDSFSNIPRPNQATLSRVASRVPSLHAATSNQHLRSHTGSVKSFKSDQSDEKSRVTSWNSTGVNTVTSQTPRTQAERDQQRLSIINENGTHVSSSSFTRPKLKNQFSAYPIMHRPSKSAGHVLPTVPGPVNSARVYSALMKRLDENSPKAKLEASRKASVESFAASQQAPLRASSVDSCRGGIPATIRQVTTEDGSNSSRTHSILNHDHQWVRADSIHSARAQDVFGHTGAHIHQWVAADPLRESRMRNTDDVFSPRDSLSNKENIPLNQQHKLRHSNTSNSAIFRQDSTKTSYYTVPEQFGLTPQELAVRNEPIVQGTKALRDARSTFFGGSSITISRTPSPFRRALAEAEYAATLTNAEVHIPIHTSPLRNPLYLAPESAAVASISPSETHGSQKAYSESVYSRTTSGHTPAAVSSNLALPVGEEDVPEMPFQKSGNGDVVIIDRTTYRPQMPANKAHRVTSSASSTEWKTWMSSEVAKLERAKENANSSSSYINYALPTMPRSFNTGHVRESAQINDDDTETAQRKISALKKPLGIIQQQNFNIANPPLLKPILKNRSAVSLVDNIESNNAIPAKLPIPPPPPIPVRSALRPVQSKSSLRSIATVNSARTSSVPVSAVKVSSMSGRNLLHKRNTSQTTLRSIKSTRSFESPAKLVKRNGRPYTANNSSPGAGLYAAVDKQFGSTSTILRTPRLMSENRENFSLREGEIEERDDLYGIEGAGLMGPSTGTREATELDAQAMGSKTMVDLFLSSRRRRIAGGASEDSGGVFI